MTNDVIICNSQISDLYDIARAENEIFSDPWSTRVLESSFDDGNYFFLLAKAEGGTLGYAIGMSVCGEVELLRIAVIPSSRRSGIGGLLMKAFIDKAKAENAEKIFLEVRASNTPARTLYSSFGFEKFAERKGYYKNPTEDAVMMSLSLGI